MGAVHSTIFGRFHPSAFRNIRPVHFLFPNRFMHVFPAKFRRFIY
ncbi:hypothetical protein B4096_0639 [Heyndrickxia coagulans]|uniref:Uncharacterized protein n=1 Tax=Heyndrickxia coagulans TaxID=1398 RepID=A0A0C5CC11_HEYCO|nr:hypothetical protein SB48_HM08orf05398 [Heyndrickxia coagulans]KWZ77796.1 hypothetical protein HMPREF3213_03226 [Heyndrickxia coagulans]KYC60322.1 hypothetical protein B4100_0670 [Heyndrickxia coagulans]KYC77677.1 hypothetical protein B4096_0639 [Heyndrickxia coagulans]